MGQQGLNNFEYAQIKGFNTPHLNSLEGMSNPTNEFDTNGNDNFDVNDKFDINKFNAAFEKNIEATTQTNRDLESARLSKLNLQKPEVKPYELSFSQMLIGIKDTWFGLTDDLLQKQYYIETFTKQNRLFFIGLTIILIIIIIYLYDIIFASYDENYITQTNIAEKKIVEIHHIYYDSSGNQLSRPPVTSEQYIQE